MRKVNFRPDMSVLEIGVGGGKAIELLRGKIKEFWGVDKSAELIKRLQDEYKKRKGVGDKIKNSWKWGREQELEEDWEQRRKRGETENAEVGDEGKREGGGGGRETDGIVSSEPKRQRKQEKLEKLKLVCLDVCTEGAFLGKKFDVVFSLDTLEHVDCPQRFFNFMARHLKDDGLGVVIFPNESEESHHGLTWFDKLEDLNRMIMTASMRVEEVDELRMSRWHLWIKTILWEAPKKMGLRLGGLVGEIGARAEERERESHFFPQEFAETHSFRIRRGGGVKLFLISWYASVVSWLVRIGGAPYLKRELKSDDIRNRRLYLILRLSGEEGM